MPKTETRTNFRYRTPDELKRKSAEVVQKEFARKRIPAYVSLKNAAPVVVISGGIAHAFYVVEKRIHINGGQRVKDADQIAAWCKASGRPVKGVKLGMLIVRNPFSASIAKIEHVEDFTFEKKYDPTAQARHTRNHNALPMDEHYDDDTFSRKSNEKFCSVCFQIKTPTGACGCVFD